MNTKIIVEVTQAELDARGTCAAGLQFDLATHPQLNLAPGKLEVVVVPETKKPRISGANRGGVNDQEFSASAGNHPC